MKQNGVSDLDDIQRNGEITPCGAGSERRFTYVLQNESVFLQENYQKIFPNTIDKQNCLLYTQFIG